MQNYGSRPRQEQRQFLPTDKGRNEACKELVEQLNKVQTKAGGKPNKGWTFNLCFTCGCDWDKAMWFKNAGQSLTLTFKNTDIGQAVETFIGTFKCKYTLTGTVTLTLKNGAIALAGCKVKDKC